MIPFFMLPERVQKLRSVISSWDGTPFLDHAGLKGKGGGSDCVHFVLNILVECGQMPEVDWPKYTVRNGGVPMLSAWVKWVVENKAGYEVTEEVKSDWHNLLHGDVLMFHGLQVGNHVGIILDAPFFWHSLIRYGVTRSTLADKSYMQHLKHVWRPADNGGA